MTLECCLPLVRTPVLCDWFPVSEIRRLRSNFNFFRFTSHLREEAIGDDYRGGHQRSTRNNCYVREPDCLSTCNGEGNGWQEPNHEGKAKRHPDNRNHRVNVHQAKTYHLWPTRPRPYGLFPHHASGK